MPSDSSRHENGFFLRFLILCALLIFSSFLASPPNSRSPSPSHHDTLTLRALVSTKDAGVIIGKAGKNVADLRDQTGVKAGVSKVIPGVHDRVLTVTGSVEAVSKVHFVLYILHLLSGSYLSGVQPHHLSTCGLGALFPRLLVSIHTSYGNPTLDLPQPDGHHHWSQWSQNQGNPRCFRRTHGRFEGYASSVN